MCRVTLRGATLKNGMLSARCSLLLIASWLVAAAANAGILVIAPHPDDDIITSAGVINRAIGREEVTVVYVSNGDIKGTTQGYLRQGEAVAAQVQYLGTIEDDLIFLGYPDGHLTAIFDNYVSPSSQYVTPFGQSVTYGNRGLGRQDYHSLRFGSPGWYNRPNIVTDLATIIDAYRPSHVYTTSEFDQHPDHAATYSLLRLALDQVHAQDSSYSPVVHKTIVWANAPSQPSIWPAPTDPSSYHTQTPGLSATPLRWTDRASLDVPLQMQNLDLFVNPKIQAIQQHASQNIDSCSFLLKFAHKDEIFWSESPFGSNQPPVAEAGQNVFLKPGEYAQLNALASRDPEGGSLSFHWTQLAGTPVQLQNSSTAYPGFVVPSSADSGDYWSFQLRVSDGEFDSASDAVHVVTGIPRDNIALIASVTASSQNVDTGQLASKAVDGVVAGYPGDYTREWATLGERAGAWLRLEWNTPYTVDRVVLYDRPNSNDQVLAGTLTFSDGSSVAVGPLNNSGSGVTLSFAPRAVTSVVFTITSASTKTRNIGLAEVEVFGDGYPRTDSIRPCVPGSLQVSGTTSSSLSLAWSASADVGGSGLAGYRIYRDGGSTPQATVTGTTFTDTGLTAVTAYSYRVTAYDGAGNESGTAGPITGTTQPLGGATNNIALIASVTASSQNANTGQLASKAVDGVVAGYPGDYTREWATLGERAGAWLRLEWNTPYTVDRVVLYDRPNSNDRVLAGTLTFSDGSNVAVGPLNNTGSGVTLSFAPRAVTSVVFTITSASTTTRNIGLAEIEVFGSSAP